VVAGQPPPPDSGPGLVKSEGPFPFRCPTGLSGLMDRIHETHISIGRPDGT
jgi:hypothetical protein